jgi:hypothetical protein
VWSRSRGWTDAKHGWEKIGLTPSSRDFALSHQRENLFERTCFAYVAFGLAQTCPLPAYPPATFGAFSPGLARTYDAPPPPASSPPPAMPRSPSVTPATSPTVPSACPNRCRSRSASRGPAPNESVTIAFKQAIKATDALRTGIYSKTLTFTLSTTTP